MLAAYIITGLLIYAEQIVLELPNADALLNSTIEKSSFKWELQLGRFMLPLYQMLFGYTISPALVTILSIFVLSISSLVITEILPFQDNIVRYLAGVFMLASPHVQSLVTYYYCSLAYSISMLYACLAVLLLVRKNFRLREGIVAAILYALSLGGYQSYLFTAATLSVMALILAVIQGETLRNLWKKFLRLLFSGGAGVILYLVLNKLALLRIHKSNVDDRGFSTMGQIDWKGLPWRIFLYVYHYNKEYFFGNELINNSYGIFAINLDLINIILRTIYLYVREGTDKGLLLKNDSDSLLCVIICNFTGQAERWEQYDLYSSDMDHNICFGGCISILFSRTAVMTGSFVSASAQRSINW
jgi:hypothetical protein